MVDTTCLTSSWTTVLARWQSVVTWLTNPWSLEGSVTALPGEPGWGIPHLSCLKGRSTYPGHRRIGDASGTPGGEPEDDGDDGDDDGRGSRRGRGENPEETIFARA
eukprot:1253715-Amphidinium_carterae.1